MPSGMVVSGDALALLGILFTIVVAVIFFIWGLTVKKPKLVSTGAGSGGISVPNKDIMASNIVVYNKPSLFGIKIDREPARITSARIYDPALQEFVGPSLMWGKNGSQELEREHTIESGRQGNLYLFAKERHSEEYFVFSAVSLNTEISRPTTKYKDNKKDFSVVLRDTIGRKYRFDIAVRNGDQSVSVSFKITWHARLNMLREGFGLLIAAFRFK
jgi:hypothetical protein